MKDNKIPPEIPPELLVEPTSEEGKRLVEIGISGGLGRNLAIAYANTIMKMADSGKYKGLVHSMPEQKPENP